MEPLYSDTDSIIFITKRDIYDILISKKEYLIQDLVKNRISFMSAPGGSTRFFAATNFSDNLGDMKHESTDIEKAEIYGPKFYRIFEKDNKSINKVKGISLKMRFEKDV